MDWSWKTYEFARYHRIPRIACDGCDWYRRVGGAGEICAMHEKLCTLAHNLAIAAGYCASFDLGRDYQHCIENAMSRHDEAAARRDEWHPGCGRSAS